MSKLQHVINYMDIYVPYIKRNIPCLEGVCVVNKSICYTDGHLEYQSMILDDCHITNFAVQDYDVSLCVLRHSQTLI